VEVKNETVPVPVDDDMMKAIARLSGGQTSSAQTADQLNNKFTAVEDQMGFQITRGSASAGWLRLAVIVASIGAALGLLINRRLPV
jgi:Ca-activated chloride channel family protein